MAHDVFISYSSKDKPTADAVCAVIEARGMRCWIAPRDVLPGQDWGEAIVDAIAASKVFLLVFSSHANASQQIKREVERAVHHALPVIPLRIEDVLPQKALEYFLSTPHWMDAFTPPMARHLDHLADVTRRLMDGADGPDTRPIPPAPQRPKTRAPATFAILAAGLAAVVLGPILIHAIRARPSTTMAPAARAVSTAPSTAPPPTTTTQVDATPQADATSAAAALLDGRWHWTGIDCGDGPTIARDGDTLTVRMDGTPTYRHAIESVSGNEVRTSVVEPDSDRGSAYRFVRAGEALTLTTIADGRVDHWEKCP